MHNTSSRGTNQFSVYISTTAPNAGWSLTLTDNLPDARSIDCANIPILMFDINRFGRYVKITLDSYYGRGSGLRYVDILYSKPCTGKYHLY